MVNLIGEKNGGWTDYYNMMAVAPWYAELAGFTALAFILGTLLLLAHNGMTKLRYGRIENSIADNISGLSRDDIREDIYKLGRNLQARAHRYEISVPVDMLKIISKKR